jgi:diacylglycerol kinase (ATP)
VRIAVIYNPSAGSGRGSAIASAVERSLVKRGFEVELRGTQSPGDAVALARHFASQAGIIVAVGGDGTINEVVNGMAGGEATLGIVPAGTVNVLALELGLPFQVERALNVIAEGKTLSLDLGKVNGHRFTLMMGAGVDALTVRNIDLRAKRRFKELAFVGAGLKSGLAVQPPGFLVRADGRDYNATFFVAGNCRRYAAHIGVTPAADPTDGALDLLIFTGTTRSSLAVFWLGVPSGLHLHNAHVICLRAERAELLALGDEGTVWFQTDGELAGRLPATVEIDAHALEVLVP